MGGGGRCILGNIAGGYSLDIYSVDIAILTILYTLKEQYRALSQQNKLSFFFFIEL